MEKGSAGVFGRYLAESRPWGDAVTLSARPLCSYRHYHGTARDGSWAPSVRALRSAVVMEGHPACGDLCIAFHGAAFELDPRWYHNQVYPAETDRGLDDAEDHFSPGIFTATISPGSPGYFWAGPVTKGQDIEELAAYLPLRYEKARKREARRRADLALAAEDLPVPARFRSIPGLLAQAADQFVVNRGNGASIIAGYHWFGEWGRDTFIALPGLLLCSGRFKEAREIFHRFLDETKYGLVPNVLCEDSCLFNSVDASLWMVNALRQYELYTGDPRFPVSLLPRLKEIASAYIQGTVYGVKATADGLIEAGAIGSQVTWMDACVDGVPVTPRQGCPVEVNALWINALETLGRWSDIAGQGDGHSYRRLAKTATRSFVTGFRWPEIGLYDGLNGNGPVKEIRPNQVIAASLTAVRLPLTVLRDIWETAIRHLLTPKGLRTLAPVEPGYRGVYKGNPAERDSAYHQGTAWPYLIGPLYDLSAKLDRSAGYAAGRGPYASFVLNRALPAIVDLDRNPCLGSVFEVASGDWPFEAGGAVSQAWSVAEVSRILYQNGIRGRSGRR